MTSSAPDDPPAAPPPPAADPAEPSKPDARRPRWLDRITLALLVFSVGLALGAAAPAIFAAVGAPLPVAGLPFSGRPIALPHRPPEILSQPGGAEGPGAIVDPDDAPRGQLGFTRVPLTIREQPAPGAEVVGKINAGELVTIPFISGEWALVQSVSSEGEISGWAKKSEIAIR